MDVKNINVEPYPLDMELIQESGKDVWNTQVQLLQQNITDGIIESAFLNIPEEVRDETVEEIKRTLKARRANLQKISDRYFDYINKYAVIKGTNKDDWFDIERLPNGKTKGNCLPYKRMEKKTACFLERVYNKEETKEIWVYGLDDDDMFHVFGNSDSHDIKVRLIGGQNNDTYNIENGKRVTFYDYKSKKNTVLTKNGRKKFSDNYSTNVYDYKKLKNNLSQILPAIGSNPDDGFMLGATAIFTNYSF